MSYDFENITPKIVLGIAAHPDDLDFGAAGSMAAFARNGSEVHYLILTDGSKGSSDKSATPESLALLRESEQRDAVQRIGGKSVTFLGYPDGELEVTLQLKKDIVRVIRSIRPDVVVTMDPSMLYHPGRGFINHPDHRAVGQATLDAVFPLARDHMSFPSLYAEGFEPHKTATVLLINFNDSNFAVDITDTFDTKIAAIGAHVSQIGDIADIRAWVHEWAAEQGKSYGYKLAESFVRIDIR